MYAGELLLNVLESLYGAVCKLDSRLANALSPEIHSWIDENEIYYADSDVAW